MGIKSLSKKSKLGRYRRIKTAPRWVDIRKFGIKRARRRRVQIDKVRRWRRIRLKV